MTNTKNASYDTSSEIDKLHNQVLLCTVADVLDKPPSVYTEGILSAS